MALDSRKSVCRLLVITEDRVMFMSVKEVIYNEWRRLIRRRGSEILVYYFLYRILPKNSLFQRFYIA